MTGALWLLAAAVLAAWAVQAANPPWQLAAAAFAWLASGLFAAAAWQRAPQGQLHWDGAAWTFRGESVEAPRAAIDLQARMLLELRGPGVRHWVWAERDAAPSDWDALRRAIYSRDRSAAPPADQRLPLA